MKKLFTDDKLYHFAAGFIMAVVLITNFRYLGFIACILIALGKEFVWDKWMKKGQFEWLDFFVTIISPIVVLIILMIQNWKYADPLT